MERLSTTTTTKHTNQQHPLIVVENIFNLSILSSSTHQTMQYVQYHPYSSMIVINFLSLIHSLSTRRICHEVIRTTTKNTIQSSIHQINHFNGILPPPTTHMIKHPHNSTPPFRDLHQSTTSHPLCTTTVTS